MATTIAARGAPQFKRPRGGAAASGGGARAAPKAPPPPRRAKPFATARNTILNDLSRLTFARVTYAHHDALSQHANGSRMCARYWGYAATLSHALSDGRRGDMYFERATRMHQGYGIGPVVLMDTHQEAAGQNGGTCIDAVPKAQVTTIFGLATPNLQGRSTRYRMQWWHGNGEPLWHFMRAMQGNIRESLAGLRRGMRSHVGARDGLFAVFLLVTMGDVDWFVRQFQRKLRPGEIPLDLGRGSDALTFAVQVARAASDEDLEDAVCRAASRVQAGWTPPPSEADEMQLAQHPDWDTPSPQAQLPHRRAERTTLTLTEEYTAVVVGIEPTDVWHVGFLQAYSRRKAAAAAPPPAYSGGGGGGYAPAAAAPPRARDDGRWRAAAAAGPPPPPPPTLASMYEALGMTMSPTKAEPEEYDPAEARGGGSAATATAQLPAGSPQWMPTTPPVGGGGGGSPHWNPTSPNFNMGSPRGSPVYMPTTPPPLTLAGDVSATL